MCSVCLLEEIRMIPLCSTPLVFVTNTHFVLCEVVAESLHTSEERQVSKCSHLCYKFYNVFGSYFSNTCFDTYILLTIYNNNQKLQILSISPNYILLLLSQELHISKIRVCILWKHFVQPWVP
jgi:hypothetical protein